MGRNFLEGIYGYFHLYKRISTTRSNGELGRRFEMEKTLFKRFPVAGNPPRPMPSLLCERKGYRAENVQVDVWFLPRL
jgi:hypothetical protein